MTIFLRLLADKDKATSLHDSCVKVRAEEKDGRSFDVNPNSFLAIPGAPFAYWVSQELLRTFTDTSAFESSGRTAKVGLQTSDNFRFLRVFWEVPETSQAMENWFPYAKGGVFSRFYLDLSLVVLWGADGKEAKAWASSLYNNSHWSRILKNIEYISRPGITWSTRTTSNLSVRVLPSGCAFDTKGCAAFTRNDEHGEILAMTAVVNSRAFGYLVELQLAAGDAAARSYDTGIFNKTPFPEMDAVKQDRLATLSRKAWSLKRILDTINEVSHAFHLPHMLRARLGEYDPASIDAELYEIQSDIDNIAFDLYGFSAADRAAALGSSGAECEDEKHAFENTDDGEEDGGTKEKDQTKGLLSWAAGVAFGRFDWRLATGELDAPPEPEPFDPLPTKSPGMLPEDAGPFHANSGILVDEQGHPNDLARLIEEVLACVKVPVPVDVRRWLQGDFFKFHLGQYSKSRRKAPIYWPISTSSGIYTLWLYYPSLTDQTLFTAVNDFIEPKLKQVDQDVAALRTKGSARSRDDEKSFEALQALELELIELRDTLLAIAQTYCPNHDDGVQITAAPLWQLFRHKPWQKILKDTWAKLEKGDYDWAHLAMAYWPDRVREKCETDKSLAIAHDLEHVYVEPEPTKARGHKKDG